MRCKRQLLIFLCLILSLNIVMLQTAGAQDTDQKTVRVGWYESAFNRTDRFGRKSGYGYEYEQRVAIFTGWTYEYVEGSWSELFEMLVNGNLDLLCDVSYTEERAEKILYSAEGMGSEDYHAFIAPDNTEISPEDFSTFNGKRVGVNKNSFQERLFVEWAKNHEVTPEIVELSGKTAELFQMLADHEIDALVTLDTYGNTADVIPVCKIGSSDFYFGINKNRSDLKQDIDVAMNRILEDNRDFNQQMTEEFNKAGTVNNFLTMEEKEWLSDHGTIRVGYLDNYLPFSSTDKTTQSLTGALSDFLSFAETAEKNAELSFVSQPYETIGAALQALTDGEIDCIFPVSLSAYDGEQLGVIITDPLVSTEMYAAVRTSDQQGVSPERKMAVAVRKGNPNYETFIMDYFPDWHPEYYDDNESAFHAVAAGDADCVLLNSYRLAPTTELSLKHKLVALTTGEDMDLSFAVNREDDCLFSILNKISRLMPGSMINSSLTKYSHNNKEHVSFGDFLKDNLAYVAAGVGVLAALIMFLLLRSVRAEMTANEGRQIISEAERDSLTQLYSRSFFTLYSNRIFRDHPERHMDAIVMNVERFHTLNSLNGRSFGDEVLHTLGKEIDKFLKETEGIAGRMEGDYFNIYCKHLDDYQALLNRFQSRINEVYNTNIRLRMGVMPWQEGLPPEEMFDRAWSACSMARAEYKTHLMIYNEEMRRRDEMNLRLQNDLDRALEGQELEVYYQPKYDIRSDSPKLNSSEALVRWQHPQMGLIHPQDFIALFERNGQISAMDIFVWDVAARQIAAWRDKYGVILPVSVNLSRVDVFDPTLFETLDGIIDKYRLARSDLKLEVTESAYTEDAEHLIRVIGQLREKGYEIEMDDFGSGYSSLNMLSSMPIDVLKMDMAFIQNIEKNEQDFHLVELILDIASYLKVPVIAEGVETENQLKLLKNAGCDIVQGFYFSKPLPADEFEQKILVKAIKTNSIISRQEPVPQTDH